MRPLRLAFVVLAAVQFALAAAAYPALPDRFPTHFDMGGAPDVWSDKSWWAWLAPLLLLTSAAAGVLGLGAFALRHPSLLNIPGDRKARWLALPPERRAIVDDALRSMFESIALATLLVGGAVQLLVWQGATSDAAPIPWPLLATPFTAIVVMLSLSRIESALETAEKGLAAR